MAVKTANVNVRVEPEIKSRAEAILEQLGISPSTLIDLTYRQVIFHNGIPFELTLPPSPGSLEDMSEKEFDEMLSTGLKQARSGDVIAAEDAFDELMQGL